MSPAGGGGPQAGRRSPPGGHSRAAQPEGPRDEAASAPRHPRPLPGQRDTARLRPEPEAKRTGRSGQSDRATAGGQPGPREHVAGGCCAALPRSILQFLHFNWADFMNSIIRSFSSSGPGGNEARRGDGPGPHRVFPARPGPFASAQYLGISPYSGGLRSVQAAGVCPA